MGKSLIQQRRGKGSTTFKAHSFSYKGKAKLEDKKKMKILDLINCRGHTAPLAKVSYDDNTEGYIIAPEGISVGETLIIGGKDLKSGNALLLKNIPAGTLIYNIEGRPGDGGKYARSSGQTAKIVSKTAKKIIVQLPSKKQKTFHPECKAIIGVVAGAGRKEKPFLKAGKKYYAMRAKNKYWPIVSGSAMNAVSHPFGSTRSSRKAKAKPTPRNAPPGRKVGTIRPKRQGVKAKAVKVKK
jgi:large subunit ribosomal protein L2